MDVDRPYSSPNTHKSLRKNVTCLGTGGSFLRLAFGFMWEACGAKWGRETGLKS